MEDKLIKSIKTLIKKYEKQGISIERIKSVFETQIDIYNIDQRTKKKKIYRPAIWISDSSDDESI